MALLVALLLLLAGGSDPGPRQTLAARYDLERRAGRFDLPGRLREVSGLTFTSGGALLAHGDEVGRVYRIDPAREAVDRGFQVGPEPLRADFEGIEAVGDRLFLVSSDGRLYEFREVDEGGASPVRITDSGAGAGCEVEGLAHDPEENLLLLACKETLPPAPEVRVHRLSLDPSVGQPHPLRVPLAALAPYGLGEGFHPSGIAVDPQTGTLVLVSAREEAIVELDKEGRVIFAVRLSPRRHPQPEGIAFGPDGRLYIADEANGRDARITLYGPRGQGGNRP